MTLGTKRSRRVWPPVPMRQRAAARYNALGHTAGRHGQGPHENLCSCSAMVGARSRPSGKGICRARGARQTHMLHGAELEGRWRRIAPGLRRLARWCSSCRCTPAERRRAQPPRRGGAPGGSRESGEGADWHLTAPFVEPEAPCEVQPGALRLDGCAQVREKVPLPAVPARWLPVRLRARGRSVISTREGSRREAARCGPDQHLQTELAECGSIDIGGVELPVFPGRFQNRFHPALDHLLLTPLPALRGICGDRAYMLAIVGHHLVHFSIVALEIWVVRAIVDWRPTRHLPPECFPIYPRPSLFLLALGTHRIHRIFNSFLAFLTLRTLLTLRPPISCIVLFRFPGPYCSVSVPRCTSTSPEAQPRQASHQWMIGERANRRRTRTDSLAGGEAGRCSDRGCAQHCQERNAQSCAPCAPHVDTARQVGRRNRHCSRDHGY